MLLFAAPPSQQIQPVIVNPCLPSPCGPNSQCNDRGGSPSCSCLPSYLGSPPNCRPECTINPECSSNLACIREKCTDPCPGSCGVGAQCNVINHTPICTCIEGYTGDPFTNCYPKPPPGKATFFALFPVHYILISVPEPTITDPCNPSPCGPNAQCFDGVCTCLPEYQGDAYRGCRPECVLSSDCSRNRACVRNKCADPCPGTCGQNAECNVVNHIPMCSCPAGFSGNAFVACRIIESTYKMSLGKLVQCFVGLCNVCVLVFSAPVATNPCNPSPCGPNSQCRVINGQAVCSCVPGFIGSPPTCRPECVTSSECPLSQACINQKCLDPCPGTCGIGANCQVVNHNPICSCPAKSTGDPFVRCLALRKLLE